MISVNREDIIQFIKDGLSKESLDNLLLTLKTHLIFGDVHRSIHDLWTQFKKDYVCQFLRKLDAKFIPNP